MSIIVRFEENTEGRDYVVGDIHGCFDELMMGLENIGFDFMKDRLFSVGDLVDRGPKNMEVLRLLDDPWFYAVKGNHEDMLQMFAEGELSPNSYSRNGGRWAVELLMSMEKTEEGLELSEIIYEKIRNMPYAFEVLRGGKKYGIVHADCPCYDWDEFVTATEELDGWNLSHMLNQTIWDRTRIGINLGIPVKNIEKVYVGHSYVKEHMMDANVHYLDTGAVFGHHLTILEIGT